MVTEETTNHIESTLAGFIGYLRRNKMSDRTITAYTTDVRGFLNRHSTELNSIVAVQTRDLEDYLYGLARSRLQFASVRRVSCALKSFFLFLLDQGVIHKNPAATLAVRPVRQEVLSSEEIVSICHYLSRRQASTERGDSFRSRRDELILILMIFYGVRQYQICMLKLSSIRTIDKSVSLTISKLFTLRLHAQVLRKLRSYLEARGSNSDTIFLDTLGKKPLDNWSVRHALNDLSQALQFDCSPKLLHNTYMYLQQHPEIRESLIKRILSNEFTHDYGVAPNA